MLKGGLILWWLVTAAGGAALFLAAMRVSQMDSRFGKYLHFLLMCLALERLPVLIGAFYIDSKELNLTYVIMQGGGRTIGAIGAWPFAIYMMRRMEGNGKKVKVDVIEEHKNECDD